jgi:hypothetical protein
MAMSLHRKGYGMLPCCSPILPGKKDELSMSYHVGAKEQ